MTTDTDPDSTPMPASLSPKFPQIEVQLSGGDGNGFVIITTVSGAMRRAGVSAQDIDVFLIEAMSGDYDHVLQTCMATVTVL